MPHASRGHAVDDALGIAHAQWHIELGSSAPGTLVEDAPIGSAAADTLRVEGKDYVQLANFETLETTLLVPDGNGGLQRGLTTKGFMYGLVKLQ